MSLRSFLREHRSPLFSVRQADKALPVNTLSVPGQESVIERCAQVRATGQHDHHRLIFGSPAVVVVVGIPVVGGPTVVVVVCPGALVVVVVGLTQVPL